MTAITKRRARSETRATYSVPALESDDSIIERALAILAARVARTDCLSSPDAVRQFLTVRAGLLDDREHFGVVWLDAQNRVITTETLFSGTLTQTAVYPREVARAALRHNAAAVIFTHNHPSGVTEPSMADRTLTESLKSTLATVDVSVLDHIITAGGASMSFAERGLI